MNKKYLLIVLLIFFFESFGQTVSKVRKVVSVMPQQTFYLNGGGRAIFGGKSRTYFQITLPKNTVSWYYTFTTKEGTKSTALNLVPQLARYFDPSGLTSLSLSAILSPTGSSSCDIYLMDRKNADAFLEKVDNWGGSFSYTISGSRQNFKNGTVEINDKVNGICYLGFKNPSGSTGINITFEVAAIVEETITDNTVWSEETKSRFKNDFYSNFKKQNVEDDLAKELSECIILNIISKKNPIEYDAMTSTERQIFLKEAFDLCNRKIDGNDSSEEQKAVNYGNLGWKSFENGEIDRCIDLSKKALTIDQNMGWVKANLGLCYLIKKQESIATDYYIEALSDIKALKLSSQRKQYLQAVIDDIDNAKKIYPDFNGNASIRSLFQDELLRR